MGIRNDSLCTSDFQPIFLSLSKIRAKSSKELITGEMPYSHITNDAIVLFSLAKGELPSAPETSTMQQQNFELWNVCKECWQPPRERPNMPTMCRILIANVPVQVSFH